ncbi:unnamed protein product [Clonostachys rhizophaga]|uniref:DUF985 domain-containing protein n=1 Tax=Clonostachys rhizophaga TaxID=160324 RepID=A0A9N9VJ96_9HYPO|nr:unnamed protein product [Clonostachys rhizophaga]
MISTPSKNEATASLIQQSFKPSDNPEHPRIQAVVDKLGLSPHIEGGYYKVTDISPSTIPSPYPLTPRSKETLALAGTSEAESDASVRLMSTTIFYYLTPNRPQGTFHANRSRIIHTLHHGRGRYVLIHPDGRLETFVVGSNIDAGERLSWVVEGGVWKASFLLPSEEADTGEEGLLISETVVPGFDYLDHEFLTPEAFSGLLPEDAASKLEWLVREQEENESAAQTETTIQTDILEAGGSLGNNITPRLSQVSS